LERRQQKRGIKFISPAARPLFQIEPDGVPTTRKKNDQNILRSSQVINLCQKKTGQSPHSAALRKAKTISDCPINWFFSNYCTLANAFGKSGGLSYTSGGNWAVYGGNKHSQGVLHVLKDCFCCYGFSFP